MPAIFAFSLLLALSVAALAWFIRLERSGRTVTVVVCVLALVVLDSSLYWSPNEVPFGLFHPRVGPLNFRLVDVIIPVAMVARLIGRGLPRRLSVTGLLWMATLVWIVAAGGLGLYYGNNLTYLTFEAKIVLYLGFMALAAGVPIADYATARPMRVLLRFASICAASLVIMDLVGVRLTAGIPLIPLTQLGRIGGDGATVFATLGLFALALSLYSDHERRALLVTAVPLLAAPIFSTQRAALVGLAVGMATLTIVAIAGRLRVRVTGPEVLLALVAALTLFFLPTYFGAITQRKPELPVVTKLERDLGNREKQLSAQDRINQWQLVQLVILEHPVFGWGLGKTYTYWDPGTREFEATFLVHNIWLDLLLRSGLVGLTLFVCATGASVLSAIRVLRLPLDPLAHAAVTASLAIILGLLAKGAVESIFEKYRLSILLATFLGVILSGRAAMDEILEERRYTVSKGRMLDAVRPALNPSSR
jgi:O-antigen ligase